MTLTEFLLARIAEDEAVAQAASPSPWSYPGIDSVSGGMIYDKTRTIGGVYYEQPEDHDGSIVRHMLVSEADANGRHIARHDPARVLAECAAKRQIVGWLVAALEVKAQAEADPDQMWGGHQHLNALGLAAQSIALPYADHPDYREEWRP